MTYTKASINAKGECVVVEMTANEEALYDETMQAMSASMIVTEQPQDAEADSLRDDTTIEIIEG